MSLKMGKVIHLGIVVEDLEKSLEIYEKELGIGPWKISEAWRFFEDKQVNEGTGLNIKTAMFHGNGYEIELVMPVGPGIYDNWLKDKGPGIHHIIFESNDRYEDVINTAKRISGREPYLQVKWPNGKPLVAYADLLKETGLLIEVSPRGRD